MNGPAVMLTIELRISGVFGVCPPSWVRVEGTVREQFREILESRADMVNLKRN